MGIHDRRWFLAGRPQMSEEDKKDVVDAINLKVVTQDGNEIFFKCKKTTPLQKLMNAFCNRQGVSMQSVRFLFDGQRLREQQTPSELDMEDGDVIDVMVEQMGSVRSLCGGFNMEVSTWLRLASSSTSASQCQG